MGSTTKVRILITGGLGVVGSGLVTELCTRGLDVYACDISHHKFQIAHTIKHKPNPLANYQYFKCNVSEYRQIEHLIELVKPDLIYHCAAEFGRWNGEDYYENLWQTNVIGTKHILSLQKKYNFKLIHFSSSEVYGDFRDTMYEAALDEHSIAQMNDYAMTKRVNEMQIQNHSLLNPTNETVIVRLFNTYGPGEYYSPYRSVNCRLLYSALHAIPWTVFKGYIRTSTYLPDVIKTLCNITDCFKPGEIYNIAGDTPHTIEELSDLILRITGADKTLVNYIDSEELTTKAKLVDNTKAKQDLKHIDTVTLEEGLRNTLTWVLDND